MEHRLRVAAISHRAVHEYATTRRCQMFEHLGHHDRLVHDISLNAMLGKAEAILVRPRFAMQLLEESLLVPHLEVVDPSEYPDRPDDRGALAQVRRNHHASLHVQLAGLTVVVHPIEKLEPRGMTAGHLEQPSLEGQPGWERGFGHTPPSGS